MTPHNDTYHLTAIRGIGDLYGHDTSRCDDAGCGANEKFLGTTDNTHLEVGQVIGLLGEAPNAEWAQVAEDRSTRMSSNLAPPS